MNKKGFTLIELLAVIVILAIIALIATPIVLNIINESRESATLRSGENYMDAVANAIARENMKQGGTFSPTECTIKNNGNLKCDDKEIIVDIDKQKPTGGSIIFNKGKVEDVSLTYSDGKTIVDDEKGNLEYLPEAVSFGTDSWDVIKANAKSGIYNVGDEREIKLDIDGDGNLTSYTLRIANLPSEEEIAEGCGTEGFSETACGFVIEFKDIIAEHVMNSTDTNKGGWEKSEMRKYIIETLYTILPLEIKNSIINTKAISSHGTIEGETNFITTDKLYLFSSSEIFGEEVGLEEHTRQLSYYKKDDANIKSGIWWLRDASSTVRTFMCVDVESEMAYGTLPTFEYGVSPAFRIA